MPLTESLARISARRPWVTIGVWLVYIYRNARSLIGNEAAESLMFPPLPSFGVVGWFRLQQRYGHILSKLSPGRRQDSNFARFTSLLDTSLFDEEGIRYTLPDHVYAEESTKW